MTTETYNQKPSRSIWIHGGVFLIVVLGAGMNGVIAVDSFQDLGMVAGFGIAMGLIMSIGEYIAVGETFNRQSGWFARIFLGLFSLLLIAAFGFFSTASVLTDSILKTTIDVKTTDRYQLIQQKINRLDGEIAFSHDRADRIQKQIDACATEYPAKKWKDKRAKCRAPFEGNLLDNEKSRQLLTSQLFATHDQLSGLSAGSIESSEGSGDQKRSQAFSKALGMLFVALVDWSQFSELSNDPEIAMAMAAALLRSLIAEFVIVLGAWFGSRFSVSKPLFLNGSFLDNLWPFEDVQIIHDLSSQMPGNIQRHILRQKTIAARVEVYSEYVRINKIPKLNQAVAKTCGLNPRLWMQAMAELVEEGRVVGYCTGHTKTMYTYPSHSNGAIEEKYKGFKVYRMPVNERRTFGTVTDFRNPNKVRAAT